MRTLCGKEQQGEGGFVQGGLSSIFLRLGSLSEGVGEPLETLVETVTGGSAGGLDVL
jgi:hypothetical protein